MITPIKKLNEIIRTKTNPEKYKCLLSTLIKKSIFFQSIINIAEAKIKVYNYQSYNKLITGSSINGKIVKIKV